MIKKHHRPEKPETAPRYRSLNRDGTDNIDRTQTNRTIDDLYHITLSISWLKFFLMSLLIYFILNLLFATVYFVLGPQSLTGIQAHSIGEFFLGCFFFSVQTFSTIGYGSVSPANFYSNILVSLEAFFGMLSIALMSGLLFARFSKPTAKIVFSEQALITHHRGHRSLVFRMANARLNRISEAEVQVIILSSTTTAEGQSLRIQEDLPLMRHRSQFFASSWTVAHVIDEKSPLFEKSIQDLADVNAEIFVSVAGFDETFFQTIHSRFSYYFDELILDKQFADMVYLENGKLHVDIDKISNTV